MWNKANILTDNKDYITEQYKNPKITQVQIANNIGVSPGTLSRFAKKCNLIKVRKSVWTDRKIEWLKENYNLTYKELENHLRFDGETIRIKLKELGLVRTTKYQPFKLDMSDKEFLSDLENPRLSAPDIVFKYKDKYGIGESRIHQLRKQKGIKLQINTLNRESIAEMKVKRILDELDLAYIKEKRIGKYSIDFYLGFNICLEVQGDYWHNKPNRKLSDKRKRTFLESKGYKMLYIWESGIENAKEDIRCYVKKQGLPI